MENTLAASWTRWHKARKRLMVLFVSHPNNTPHPLPRVAKSQLWALCWGAGRGQETNRYPSRAPGQAQEVILPAKCPTDIPLLHHHPSIPSATPGAPHIPSGSNQRAKHTNIFPSAQDGNQHFFRESSWLFLYFFFFPLSLMEGELIRKASRVTE